MHSILMRSGRTASDYTSHIDLMMLWQVAYRQYPFFIEISSICEELGRGSRCTVINQLRVHLGSEIPQESSSLPLSYGGHLDNVVATLQAHHERPMEAKRKKGNDSIELEMERI